jgi:hypothetical protein
MVPVHVYRVLARTALPLGAEQRNAGIQRKRRAALGRRHVEAGVQAGTGVQPRPRSRRRHELAVPLRGVRVRVATDDRCQLRRMYPGRELLVRPLRVAENRGDGRFRARQTMR